MSGDLLDAQAALERICSRVGPLPHETRAVDAALGRVLRQDVASPADLPPFDNSAMDGFALAADGEFVPAGSELPIVGTRAAGDAAVAGGVGAWEIMTGARLPQGLDRVVPVERTRRLTAPPRVQLEADVKRGQNVRLRGSDVACGEDVLLAGTVLAPQHLMLLAALGVAELAVSARPRVAVLCTGRELVDAPGQSLASGEIRNSNGPFLAARVPRAGAELAHAETVGDEIEAFLAALERAQRAGAHVIVSTGAVSMGRHDFIPQALRRIGAEILLHRIAIRPGKPLLAARLPDGRLFLGLPGNPIAVAVGWRFFVEPALRVMLGLAPEQPWRVPLAADQDTRQGLRFHLKSRLALDAGGRLTVHVLPGQESYRIRPLAAANAWVVIPASQTDTRAGTLVDVYGLGHLDSPVPDTATR